MVLLAGETGCGKTTQVPQFLLDHCWAQSKACRVMCTQPRVISARTVAERVAAERGETVGGTVGYQARTDTVVRMRDLTPTLAPCAKQADGMRQPLVVSCVMFMMRRG